MTEPSAHKTRTPGVRTAAVTGGMRAPTTSDMVFWVGCAAVLIIALVCTLVIRIQVDSGSFQISKLTAERDTLQERIEAARLTLNERGTPQNLSAAAAKLGMVPAPAPAFLEVGTSTVIGTPTAAKEVDAASLGNLGDPVAQAEAAADQAEAEAAAAQAAQSAASNEQTAPQAGQPAAQKPAQPTSAANPANTTVPNSQARHQPTPARRQAVPRPNK